MKKLMLSLFLMILPIVTNAGIKNSKFNDLNNLRCPTEQQCLKGFMMCVVVLLGSDCALRMAANISGNDVKQDRQPKSQKME